MGVAERSPHEWGLLLLFLLLPPFFLAANAQSFDDGGVVAAVEAAIESPIIDLNLQNDLRSLNRMKRAAKLMPKKFTQRTERPSRCDEQRRSVDSLSVPVSSSSSSSSQSDRINRAQQDLIHKLLRLDRRRDGQHHNDTGKCVISADQAVHYCGFTEEVTAPIIPPPQQGQCFTSTKSGREVCYPSYDSLDTTCTDSAKDQTGPIPPPFVAHATVRAMAFVAPDDLQRLIKQYYRQNQQPIPKEINFKLNPYLFARYKCDYGYELVDEVETVFCSNRQWVSTLPICRGKGPCADENGGCSHSCISPDNVTIECRCPKGLVLDSDERTCIRPAPKNMCKNLVGCTCESINDKQLSCICRPSGEKCLLEKGPPTIHMHPPPPHQVEPGGSLNITCSGVGYPFPQTNWEAVNDVPFEQRQDPNTPFNQVLSVSELTKNGVFKCHSVNKNGAAEKTVEIVVAGPAQTAIDHVDPGRTNMDVHWIPPDALNRPITHYTIYYTSNPQQPVKSWNHIDVNEPNHHGVIENLLPDTQYTIRVRANDNLGPGKLSNAITVKTMEAAKRPALEIAEGEELMVPPGEPFTLNCNVTRGDPTPVLVWESKGRKISNPQEGRVISLQHKGLIEETSFLCVAENEAGKTSKRVHVIVTGPTAPEKIRTNVDGDDVHLQWDPPRITNGPMQDYEILYTTDPSLPEDQWKSVSSGGQTEVTIPDLREMTDYTFRIKGKNANGQGLPSRDYNATTWLKPRTPEVQLIPSEAIVAAPSTQELAIECHANGVPKPKIIWFWEDQPIEDGKDGFRVYDTSRMDVQNLTTSKLIAQSTTRSGTVRCEAVNKEGDAQKSVDVKINGPGSPPVNIQPSPIEDGFNVQWTEPAIPNGDITNYVIYYTKDPDKPLDEWQTEAVTGDKTDLLIPNKDEDTPYVVRVQAVTPDGPGIISEPFEVTTGRKHIPLTVRLEIIDPVATADEVEVDPGQSIQFRCVAEGRPAPAVSYTWLPLNNTESGEEPVHIRASPHDTLPHTYVSDESSTSTFTKRFLLCQARNADGAVDDRRTFVVKKPGSPPLEISPNVDVDNKVVINWNPPIFPNGDLEEYKVYLSADPSKPLDQWQNFDVKDLDNPKIEFSRGELEPETPYFVQIAAVNKDGEGIKSPVVEFKTASGAPLDAPTDIVGTVSPDNTLNISWAGPAQPNGPITAYTVYFTPEDSDLPDENYKQWPKVSIPSDQDLANISLDRLDHNIKPNTPYKVRIAATNDMNEGPASDPIVVTTGSGEIPPTIRLSPADNPTKVDPKADYTVTCAADGIPEPTIYWTVNGERNEGTFLQLSGLLKDTIAICHAENNAGATEETLRIEVQGPGTPPNALALTPLPDQEIEVEWTPPDEPNGQIDSYIVHYGELPDGETSPPHWETVTVPGTQVSTVLRNLNPKANYEVKVQAVSDRGPGVIGDAERTRTLPLTPPPPVKTKADVQDNNTVVVAFDAVADPSLPEKKIKEYIITYTDEDPINNDTVWKQMVWTNPDDSPTVQIPIDGDNFRPNTKYTAKVTPKGEIEGTASDPITFQTGDGIIAPDTPLFNVDAPDNTIRMPAGTDYSVQCSSTGHPLPKIRWVDENGATVSDSPVLHVSDVKTTQKLKCIAENAGGTAEEDFTIFVAGPGNAPEITQIHSHKPRQLEVRWEPPTIPNGEITRYIIYYTPLDDQDPAKQVGQVPAKPVVEWLTHHVTGENLNEGEKEATLKDFLEPDTAYAIVIQAVNDDGPGPYSIQHTIRTMSRAQEGPPTDLRVEPIDQRSVEVDWKPPENVDENPIGYELYYVPANKEIEVDEFESLPKWTKIAIDDPAATSHVLRNELEPNTEYVFKIRAIYPKGPGVFSEPCITRTLPEGSPPLISVSSGGEGTAGTTEINLLPGSAITVFCNATGNPQPSVNWIRQGGIAIDPSTVRAEGTATRWSLKVANITEDTTFNCVAQNPLGISNWSIDLNVVKDLPSDWRKNLVKPKLEDGVVVLDFDPKVSQHLKDPSQWKVRYTTDPNKPRDEWTSIDGDGDSLDNVRLADAEPGKPHYVTVTDPSTGIETPIFTVIPPNPAKITNLGANINDEVVVDFKPAVGPIPVSQYEIRYWPTSNRDDVRSQVVSPANISGNIIRNLEPDTDYEVQVITTFSDGGGLPGAIVPVKTPPHDIHCECSHACHLIVNSEGKREVQCFCPPGYELANDGKTCEKTAGAEEPIVVEVTPTYDFSDLPTSETGVDGSPLPTDDSGRVISVTEDATPSPYPTDSVGREIRPVVRIDGSRLPIDPDGNTLNQLGRVVERDEDNRPLGPDGALLTKTPDGDWLYPELDNDGHPLPLDRNGRPVYPILGPDGSALPIDSEGRRIDKNGNPVPTDAYGKPMSPDGSPLPKDAEQNYRWYDEADFTDETPHPTDDTGRIVHPVVGADGELLPTSETGRHVDADENELPLDDRGLPLDPKTGDVLPKNARGQFVLARPATADQAAGDRHVGAAAPDDHPADAAERTVPIVGPDGAPLPTNYDGQTLSPDGEILQKDGLGRPLDRDGSLLPTDSSGRYVFADTTPMPTDSSGRFVYPVRFPDGQLLPTDDSGRRVDADRNPIAVDDYGRPIGPDADVLPTDSAGTYIYPDKPPHPTDSNGRKVTPVGPDGRPLEVNDFGQYVDEDGSPIPTNAANEYVGPDGSPLPVDPYGRVVVRPDVGTKTLPTDDIGRPIHPVVGPDGSLLPTDSAGHFVQKDGEPIPVDDSGRPIQPDGQLLPTDDRGYYIQSDKPMTPTDSSGRPVVVVGADGVPLAKNDDGFYVKEDGQPVPTNAANEYVGPDGSPLPVDSDGRIVVKADDETKAVTLPTDETGRLIHPIVNNDGELLPTDSTGHHVAADGIPIPIDDFGRPIGPDGRPLPRNDADQFIYTPKPTDRTGHPVAVVGPDGALLPTDASGRFVDKDDTVIPVDQMGRPVGPDGHLLPTDAEGNYVHAAEDQTPTAQPTDQSRGDASPLPTDVSGRFVVSPDSGLLDNQLPTDSSGKLVHPIVNTDGELLPTDGTGRYVNRADEPIPVDDFGRPLDPDGKLLPRDPHGRYIHKEIVRPTTASGHPVVVVGPDGIPLPTDRSGIFVQPDGTPVPTNAVNEYVGPDGSPLPTDAYGQIILQPHAPPEGKTLPTDESGRDVHPIVDGDGNPLNKDSTGRHVDKDGEPIPVDDFGRPTHPDGRLLPTDSTGNYIFTGDVRPTDAAGHPIAVVAPDGAPLPTDHSGHFLRPDGSPIPTNADLQYVGADGTPLPTDSDGRVVFGPDASAQPLPTDDYGRRIFPIVGPDHQPLPTDSTGHHIKADGAQIPIDSEGRPIGPDGQILPTNPDGEYIFIPEERPTDASGKLLTVVGPDGIPLPTDSSGRFVRPDGEPVPTDSGNNYVGPDGSPLPVDPYGRVVVRPDDETTGKSLPTDETGKPIYPIVLPDGSPLPTDSSGRFVDFRKEPIPLDDFGRPLGPDHQILPTNDKGEYVHHYVTVLPTHQTGDPIVVVGPDGHPLPTDRSGLHVRPDGSPLPTNAQNEYVGPDGSPLPTDVSGRVILPDSQTESALPTDETGKPVHPIVDSAGELLPTDSTGHHTRKDGEPIPVDDFGRPLAPDGSILPKDDRGYYKFGDELLPPAVAVVGPDGIPLPTDPTGHAVQPDGQPVPTNADHQYVGADGSPLPTDLDGRVVFGADEEPEQPQHPTDESGQRVYPIVDRDGRLLPTDSTGRHVDRNGEPIQLDESGRPLDSDGNPLSKDPEGRYVHFGQIRPTDESGKPVVVIGPDGPLPTNHHGIYVNPDGSPVPTNVDHEYVGPDGSPLPKDADGNVILKGPDDESGSTLPTDDTGKLVYPIVDPAGRLLPTDSTGRHTDPNGELIPLDDFGRPTQPDGKLLAMDEFGRYVHPGDLPVDAEGRPIVAVGPDGSPLPTDRTGHFIQPDGSPLPTSPAKEYMGPDGSPLPTNADGRVVFDPDAGLAGRTLPTDSSGRAIYPVVYPNGDPLPTDYTGHHTDDRGEQIPLDEYGRPLGPDNSILPKNPRGQYVFGGAPKPTGSDGVPIVVTDADGRPLPTDHTGLYIAPNGSPVPTNADNEYIGPDGELLPRDSDGRAVYPQSGGRTLPSDEAAKPIHPIVRPDGSLLPTDSTGHHVGDMGEPIQLDEFSRPLGPDGYPLPTNSYNHFVYSGPTKAPIVVGPDGSPVPTNSEGRPLDPNGDPLPTDSAGHVLAPDGSPLSLDADGRYVLSDAQSPLPTDSDGKSIYPVVDSDGRRMPTNSEGRYTDPDGEPIPVDDFGRPVDADGHLFSTNDHGDFVYTPARKSTQPYDRPVTVVGPDGSPLPTDTTGSYVINGKPVPTDPSGHILGPDGQPLPVDDSGVIFVTPDVTLKVKTLPTDVTRKIVLPVVDESGQLRPTGDTGHYVDVNGSPLETDEYGRPHYPDGELLRADSDGNYVYEDKRKKTSKFCFVDGYIELLIVLDTSANVKILDHRLMKETIKTFLKENFDLRDGRVRVGVIKFGSEVETPIALGDYTNVAELLSRLGDARRLKGVPRLGEALREAVSEFSISGSPDAPKVVMVVKNGNADDDFASPAEALRDETKAEVFVVTVGDEDTDDNEQIVGSGNTDRILRFRDWRNIEPADLAILADRVCDAIPEHRRRPAPDAQWPTRPPTRRPPASVECSSIDYEVDLVVVLDSSQFSADEFTKTVEGVGTLIDESFDLAPDVVRAGFIVFSDKVSVPVALGHYEDKIELLQKIETSEQMDGNGIVTKGLDAARQQFQLHGRNGVSKVVLLITNGNYRGNAASFTRELRDTHDIQLFVLAIHPTQGRAASLSRLVGVEYANERLLTVPTADDLATQLGFIRSSLCGHITHQTRPSGQTHITEPHRTSKRHITLVTKKVKEPCDDEEKRPLSVNIVVDAGGTDNSKSDIDNVRNIVNAFLEDFHSKHPKAKGPVVNLLNIDADSQSLLKARTKIPTDNVYRELDEVFDEAQKENEKTDPECNHA